MVSSHFRVIGFNQSPVVLQVEISGDNVTEQFRQLVQKLETKNILVRLESDSGRMFLLISRFEPPKSRRSWIPRALFAATIVTVMIDGYYRAVGMNSIVKGDDPFYVAVLYTASLIGILGIHELGHMIASKIHKLRISWPYFIPGIPVLGFVPTFGALIMSRGLIVNRNILFDVGISGPIAGLIIAIIVSTYGASVSPLIPTSQAQELAEKLGLVDLHSSVIMDATIALVGKHVPHQELVMSPVLLAAWFGFLITFLNLLPAWQLDGGHIARATFGIKWHRILTYVSIGILAATGYYIMALFVLIFSMRSMDVRPLDDISPLSKKRKKMFIIVMILAFLCAPLPFSILPQ
ncbi:putative peptidase family M50 [Nitrosotalea sinensis]|uniref:Putative peptidase family M50 n=1 Tax=Nitrosotalea sinensis TaxID=1499975 RepID=A0A2H1EGW6_9ARCH|nr:site-2 protease family protein [Candidatus Nitrosotalea sinensis]SHO44535.1 putative peptidase family M50 [Candidatus Nitrosotalea sinensis]